MKLRDLFVSIGFDVDDKQLKALDKGLAQTKTLILALGTAAVAAAGSLYLLAKNVADAGDNAAKTAGRMGINLELLQEYQYAAQLAGMSTQELNMNMEQFIRRSADAAKGTGEAKAAFAELGIQIKDANGQVKSSDRLMGELADKFSQIQDGSTKVRLAYDLFGRSGIGMINMLNQGSATIASQREEARRLGVVLSEKVARDAEQFTDDLLRAESVIAGIKNQVGGDLLPVFIDLLVKFRQWALAHRQLIASGIERFMRGLITLMSGLYRGVSLVVDIMKEVVDVLGGMERIALAVAWSLGLLAGAQVLSAIGNLTMGFVQLTRVIKGVGSAALVANLKAAAVPVLIGAAVAAAILIIQDLVSYFQGKKSVTGIMLAAFEKHFPMIYKIMTFSIGDALDWIEQAFGASVDWIMEKLAPLLDAIATVKQWLQSTGGKVMGAFAAADRYFGFAPATAPAAGTNVNSRQDVRVNAPVTVTVPEGTPTEAVSQAVRQGISDGMARMLRDASLALEPMVEH